MSLKEILKKIIPGPVRSMLRSIRNSFLDKHVSELAFWQSRHQLEKGKFTNAHYKKIMLGMAEEPSGEFLRDKIVADFGCGPRGSLVWAEMARIRIGIDVLADRYIDEFSDDLITHDMIYLKSTENVIPLPSEFIDIMFTVNAIDHVDNFSTMCSEILRVMKPGGRFIGSFNLEEPVTRCEPNQLNENIIRENLLDDLEIESYRITSKGPVDNYYAPFFDGKLIYEPGEEGFLWVKARKPS